MRTGVAVVHCETTSGSFSPIQEIGQVARKHHKTYFVDSMSAFGAVPFDFEACGIRPDARWHFRLNDRHEPVLGELCGHIELLRHHGSKCRHWRAG